MEVLMQMEDEAENQTGSQVKMTSINNTRPNTLMRVSVAFEKRLLSINKERSESNLRTLSAPKITELIIRHKSWGKIQEDIINFLLDDEDDEE